MAPIALFAPMARSTNRSTPTMAATGCQLQNATAFRPISACPRLVAKAPGGESNVTSALTTKLYRFGVPGHVGCHLARRSASTGRVHGAASVLESGGAVVTR